MNVNREAQHDINDMAPWDAFVMKPRKQMDNTQERLTPLVAIQAQIVGVDHPIADTPWGTPWDDCYPDECGAQGAAPCVEQLPNCKGAEPVAISDDAIQSVLESFWDVAAEPPSHLEVS